MKLKCLILRAFAALMFILPSLAPAQVVNPHFLAPGAGSVSRTFEDKATDFLSVKDCGAKGDGVADDTAALQTCLNRSRDVWVPAGTYLISSSLVIPNRYGHVLRGEYQLSKLQATFAGPIISYAAGQTRQYSTIDGITFRASGAGAGAAIGIAGNAGLSYIMFADITRCLFSGTLRYGITGNFIVSEISRNSFGSDQTPTGTFKPFKLYGTDSFQAVLRLTNNEFNSGNDDYAGEITWAYSVILRGNVFEQNKPTAGVIKVTDVHGLRIENGWHESNGAVPLVKTFDGAHLADMRIVFDNNYFEGTGSGAKDVLLDSTNASAKRYVLTNNTISNYTKISLNTGNYDLPQEQILTYNNKPFGVTPAWVDGWVQHRGSFIATLTGCASGGTAVANYQRTGDIVVVTIPTLSCTSNSTAKSIKGLPAHLIPVAGTAFVGAASDNGGVFQVNQIFVNNTGIFTVNSDMRGTAWTASGLASVMSKTYTYNVAH